MKTLLSLFMVFSFAGLAFGDDPPKFVIAIESTKEIRTSLKGDWGVEIGEVYKFLRYMSEEEYNGNTNPTATDKTYYVLKLDDGLVFAKVSAFAPVPEKDLVAAALKYNEMVKQYRAGLSGESQTATTTAAQPQRPAIDPELVRRLPPTHRRYSDNAVEAKYLEICNRMHIQNGYWPTNAEIEAQMHRELDPVPVYIVRP